MRFNRAVHEYKAAEMIKHTPAPWNSCNNQGLFSALISMGNKLQYRIGGCNRPRILEGVDATKGGVKEIYGKLLKLELIAR
jgi:hypothetical protein